MYIRQRATMKVGVDVPVDDALSEVRRLIDEPSRRLVVVLGDFGIGKTFLLHKLAHQLGTEIAEGRSGVPVPLLLEMRELHKSSSLDELLAQHLVRRNVDNVSIPALRYMIEQGRVVLFFDGFDELALRLTYDRAAQHLGTMLEAVRERARVVMTCREQHFRDSEQFRTALALKLTQVTHRTLRLEKFDIEQIRQFFARTLGQAADAPEVEERMDLLHRVSDLSDLGRTPRMLSFIARLSVEQLQAAAERERGITSAKLYAMLVEDNWISHELKRVDLPGAQQSLSRRQLLEAVERVALRLWPQTERAISLDDLRAVVREALATVPRPEKDFDVATFQVGSGSLLSRDGEAMFSFFHQSVMEWLVVRRATTRWKDEERETWWDAEQRDALFAGGKLSQLMAQFLVETLGGAEATRALEAVRAGGNDRAQQNAVQVQAKVRGAAVDLHDRDLREIDLEPFLDRLEGADLSGAVLDGLQLRFVSLRRANLRMARLRGVDLTDANLTGADLTGADLTGAILTRAVLTRAKLDDARVDRASFLLADVEDRQIPRGRFLDHTPRRIDRAEPRLVTACDTLDVRGSNAFCVALHPGAPLLAFSSGSTVLLADAETGAVYRVLEGHAARVTGVAFSPDGERIATSSWDRTACVWDTRSGALLATFEGHTDAVTCVAFDADGARVVTGAGDHTARLWDVRSGASLETLRGHTDWVTNVALSPDGTLVVTGSDDCTARLWDARGGGYLAVLEGHSAPVTGVAFDRDGTRVGTASWDHTARVWDGRSREQLASHAHPNWVTSVAFSPDGKQLATGAFDGCVRVWDARSAKVLAQLWGPPRVTMRLPHFEIAPDGAEGRAAHVRPVFDDQSDQKLPVDDDKRQCHYTTAALLGEPNRHGWNLPPTESLSAPAAIE